LLVGIEEDINFHLEKLLGHEVDHFPPTRVEFMKTWIYIFTPPDVSMV
jgi:hypothetical protein